MTTPALYSAIAEWCVDIDSIGEPFVISIILPNLLMFNFALLQFTRRRLFTICMPA
jgi:hypothetical protein